VRKPAKRWRGLLVLAAALVAAALLLGACGSDESSDGASPSSEGTPKPGGTYNFVLGSDPVAIDPVLAYESEGMQVVHQAFETLVKASVDDQGNVVPVAGLAESWETTDNQTWTFKLKQGITFAPPVSRAVTAQDFVDSWNYVTDPANASNFSYIMSVIEGCGDDGYAIDPKAGLTGVTAPDDYTLVVKLKQPFAEFLSVLLVAVTGVQPVDYINEVGYKAYHEKPVGTGPYMVTKWNHKSSIEMDKNPTYWDKESAGWVDKIHMPIITSSQTSWLQFQKGDVDYTTLPPGQFKAAQAMPQTTSGEWTVKGWTYIANDYVLFNMNDEVVGGEQGRELRKALYMAADAQNVVNIVHEGQATVATSFTPNGLPGWVGDLSPYKANDLEGAKAILANLTVPTLTYWYNTDESNQKTAEVLQAGWQDAGVTVKLAQFEWATFLDKVAKGEGQVYRSGWLADYPSLDNFLYPLWDSSQPGNLNSAFYKNPEFDALIKQARSTGDATQRYDLYHQAETLMLTDAPTIPLAYPLAVRATNNRLGGFFYDPLGFVDMWKLWVK
jgi:peptide/nickel transport system substrate-binding protein/oligopeptide transport system substrate-binding protein